MGALLNKITEGVTLREVSATIIALGILALNFIAFLTIGSSDTFSNADQSELLKDITDAGQRADLVKQIRDSQFSQMKDILLLATGFLGIVLGYYFGRIPAEKAQEISEKQAEKSQDLAKTATENAAKAEAEMASAKTDLMHEQAKLEAANINMSAERARFEVEKTEIEAKSKMALVKLAGDVSSIDQKWSDMKAKLGVSSEVDDELRQFEASISSAKASLPQS